MSIFDFIKKQFVEVIEWNEADEETLAWHFPIADNEIKNGAQLTVRPTQAAARVVSPSESYTRRPSIMSRAPEANTRCR